MADDNSVQISFPGRSRTEAGKDAQLLEQLINDRLREAGAQPAAQQRRTDPNAADIGTIVSIVLAAPATIILARGIAKALQAYFSRTNQGTIVVTKPDGTSVTVTSLESRDAEKLVGKLGLG